MGGSIGLVCAQQGGRPAQPAALMQAAGGIVTDWQGGSAAQGGQVIAAASEALHRAALDLLNG